MNLYILVADRSRIEGPTILGIFTDKKRADHWLKLYKRDQPVHWRYETMAVLTIESDKFEMEGHHI